MPSDIQNRLKGECASWKIQESADLSEHARKTWTSATSECPGIAKGQFEGAKAISYGVLLVPAEHPDAGYRFLVFSRKGERPDHDMAVVEKSDDSGASNFFIRKVPISKFFSEKSKRKFQVQPSEGILMVDSAEKENEADVYFWSKGSYQHQPVDY